MLKKLGKVLILSLVGVVLLTGAAFGEETESTEATTATASGTLKAVDVDNSTVMIITENNENLLLKFTEESQVKIGETLADLPQLTEQIDSAVEVEFEVTANTVINISIK